MPYGTFWDAATGEVPPEAAPSVAVFGVDGREARRAMGATAPRTILALNTSWFLIAT
jgi:hypothetical protein